MRVEKAAPSRCWLVNRKCQCLCPFLSLPSSDPSSRNREALPPPIFNLPSSMVGGWVTGSLAFRAGFSGSALVLTPKAICLYTVGPPWAPVCWILRIEVGAQVDPERCVVRTQTKSHFFIFLPGPGQLFPPTSPIPPFPGGAGHLLWEGGIG